MPKLFRARKVSFGGPLLAGSLYLLLLLLTPTTACAASTLTVSGPDDSALLTAIAAAEPGTIIEITGDIELGGTITIAPEKDITIRSAPGGLWTLSKPSAGRHFILTQTANDASTLTLEHIVLDGGGVGGGITLGRGHPITGGGVLFLNEGAVLQNCLTKSATEGGALTVYNGGTATVNGGTIRNNVKAAAHGGGGVFVGSSASYPGASSTFTLNDGTISGNRSTGVNTATFMGGGVAAQNRSTVNIHGGSIVGNEANAYGGGVSVTDATLNITGGEISGNLVWAYASLCYGGGIYLEKNSVLSMTGGTVADNIVKGSGGGIAVSPNTFSLPSLSISNAVITGNYATSQGGGIYTPTLPDLHLDSIHFEQNWANTGYFWTLDTASAHETVRTASQTHEATIRSTAYSTPFENAYNNYDIGFPSIPSVTLSYYKATFHSNGGSSVPPQFFLSKTPLTPPADPIREGYDFDGWYRDEALTTPWDFERDAVNFTITLYAGWTLAVVPEPPAPPEPPESPESPEPAKPIKPKPEPLPAPAPEELHTRYLFGYPDGSVHPDDPMTRAETAALLSRLMEGIQPEIPAPPLRDVAVDAWYYPGITCLMQSGVLTGYPDGTFRPEAYVTRAEFLKFLSALGGPDTDATAPHFSDLPRDHWAAPYIAGGVAKGWVIGYPDGTFRPDAPILRGEAVAIVNHILGRRADPEALPADTPLYTDLTGSHWAYLDLAEASCRHLCTRTEDGRECWVE